MKFLKRIFAMIGVIFFAGLYISTLIVAFLDFPYQQAVLQALIFSTFFITLFIAAFAAVFRRLKQANSNEPDK